MYKENKNGDNDDNDDGDRCISFQLVYTSQAYKTIHDQAIASFFFV